MVQRKRRNRRRIRRTRRKSEAICYFLRNRVCGHYYYHGYFEQDNGDCMELTELINIEIGILESDSDFSVCSKIEPSSGLIKLC